MKKTLSILLAICMVISTSVFTINAAADFTINATADYEKIISSDGLWEYRYQPAGGFLNISGYLITDYLGEGKNITLPEEIDGNKISLVHFTDNSKIEHITVPVTYRYFYQCDFADMSNLKTITFSREYTADTAPVFDTAMFAGDEKLESVVLPNYIDCRHLIRDFIGYKEHNYLGEWSFENCKSLKNIVFPENITALGDECFKNCSSLTEIVIPEGVEVIGSGCFYGCSSLEVVTFPDSIRIVSGYDFGYYDETGSYTIPETTIFVMPANSYPLTNTLKEDFAEFNYPNQVICSTPTEINGDVTGDSELNINDVTLLQKKIAEVYNIELNNCDFDGNGKININDCTKMQRAIANITQ